MTLKNEQRRLSETLSICRPGRAFSNQLEIPCARSLPCGRPNLSHPPPLPTLIRNRVKVNSMQKACAKSLAVHLLKFEILQTTWNNKTKNISMLNVLVKYWKLRVWCSLFHFFMWFARFFNFNMWTAKH